MSPVSVGELDQEFVVPFEDRTEFKEPAANCVAAMLAVDDRLDDVSVLHCTTPEPDVFRTVLFEPGVIPDVLA